MSIDALKALADQISDSMAAARCSWCADPVAAAFMADIIENPADDTPRLVLCDWLEENGQAEMAEFIRLGLEMAANGQDCCFSDNPELRCKRDGCLLCQSENLLYGGAAPIVPISCGRDFALSVFWWARSRPEWPVEVGYRAVEFFHRGFISAVTLPLALFMETAGDLFRANPITEVRLSDRAPADLNPLIQGFGVRFGWQRSAGEKGESFLPSALFNFLDGTTEDPRRSLTCLYDQPFQANDALSDACVSYGHREATRPTTIVVGQPLTVNSHDGKAIPAIEGERVHGVAVELDAANSAVIAKVGGGGAFTDMTVTLAVDHRWLKTGILTVPSGG